MNQELKGLYRQKQILEAQMNAYEFSFSVFDANRLLIRINTSAECILPIWNSSRELLNKQTRGHVALEAEYQTVLRQLVKINSLYATNRILSQEPPKSDQ